MTRVEVGFTLQPDDDFLDRTAPLLARVDYAEVAPETTWHVEAGVCRPNGFHRRFRALAAEHALSLVAHGVGYSIGDPGGEARRARWREWVARDHAQFGFRWYSDHLWATAIGDAAVTLPIALPFDEALAARARARLRSMAEVVPVVGVETTVTYFGFGDPMGEPAWLNAILDAPARLVLDLHNVHTLALNHGFDPDAWIARLDLERVIEIHVSGGAESDPAWLPSGRAMRLDAHSHAVPEAVFALLDRWAPRCPALRGITLERMEGTVTSDAQVAELADELARVRAVADRWTERAEAFARVASEAVPFAMAAADAPALDALAALGRAGDPVASLRAAGLDPNHEDGARIAALLAGRLRFERLVRGSGQVERWFDEDPEGFVEAFRAYHAEVPPAAFFPADEARAFDAWLRARSR